MRRKIPIGTQVVPLEYKGSVKKWRIDRIYDSPSEVNGWLYIVVSPDKYYLRLWESEFRLTTKLERAMYDT